MANLLIDWHFQSAGISNLDGTRPAIVQNINEVDGPGNTALGARPKAVRFGSGVQCVATLSPGDLNATRFAVRVSFRVTSQVMTRGNLIECTALPFAVYVQPGHAPDRFNIEASVHVGTSGWSNASTQNRQALVLDQWYTASIVYDLDTLALMVEDTVIAVVAFPNGGLHAPSGDQLHVGAWVDGRRWPFLGEIAGVQVWQDIPAALEVKLDAERGNAEWHLTRKEQEVRSTLNLGPRNGDFYCDPSTGSYIQSFALAVISYTEAHGTAFVMYGVVLNKWRSDENLRRTLGSLVSDEISGRRRGSRKSVFSQGCIYWLPITGAVPVTGRMYLDYELIGEGSHAIGMPVAEAQTISGGKVQQFQSGKMFFRNGASNAFEVHGDILRKYEAAGGPSRFGFPISHESDVLRGTRGIGKISEFERCSIYWSPTTPASIIYGSIRDHYRGAPEVPGAGGPLGDLGFPTSDESDIPDAPGARYNTFEHGSILWFNGPVFVCRPFKVSLGRLDTKEEDRDWLLVDLDGQNDLFCRVCMDVNGGRVFDRKYPENQTHYPSNNIYNLNLNVPYTVTPNSPAINARVRVEVWESDDGQIFGGKNAHLGTMTKDLNMANAWGNRENNGLFESTNFGPWVNRLDWSVKPLVSARTPLDTFNVVNRGTATVDWREFAAAFSDVDPDPEVELDFSIIDDGLKALYYEAVVKNLASGGNCFGMALENIYAWKEQSRLGRPLARFNNWAQVENDFNVKHAYQVGADAIWWMVGQFLGGNTHNPKGVFQASWDAFNRGENPVICIAQNYDFSGAPHCIMPISWNSNVTPWRMEVFDSNFPNQRRVITINPSNNRFSYDGSSDGSRIYTGDAWSGGRLQFIPWSVLNHRQRTPVWDAILLMLGGVVLLFGESTDVVSLTDENGHNLDAAASKNHESLSGKLLGLHGMSGTGPVKGSFFVGRPDRKPLVLNPNVFREISQIQSNTAPSNLVPVNPSRLRPSDLRRALTAQPSAKSVVTSDAPANAIDGAALMALTRSKGIPFLRPNQATDLDTIRCTLKGRAAGDLDNYYKRGLLGLHVTGDIKTGEKVKVDFERITGRENEVRLQSDRNRTFTLEMSHKLGAGKDFLKTTIHGVSPDAGQAARINLQPGSRVIDVLSSGQSNVRIAFEGVVSGNTVKSHFLTQLQGGQRIVIPDLADPSRIKVGDIDTLLGDGRNFKIISKQ